VNGVNVLSQIGRTLARQGIVIEALLGLNKAVSKSFAAIEKTQVSDALTFYLSAQTKLDSSLQEFLKLSLQYLAVMKDLNLQDKAEADRLFILTLEELQIEKLSLSEDIKHSLSQLYCDYAELLFRGKSGEEQNRHVVVFRVINQAIVLNPENEAAKALHKEVSNDLGNVDVWGVNRSSADKPDDGLGKLR
jgi:hypothetical protein